MKGLSRRLRFQRMTEPHTAFARTAGAAGVCVRVKRSRSTLVTCVFTFRSDRWLPPTPVNDSSTALVIDELAPDDVVAGDDVLAPDDVFTPDDVLAPEDVLAPNEILAPRDVLAPEDVV